MAHEEQIDFCKDVLSKFPDHFKGGRVLDIGSLDVNGNNRWMFDNCWYVGCDLGEGKNVDVICPGHEYEAPLGSMDVVISTEAFEHDQHLDKTLNHAVALLRSGGLLLFTCAGPDRWEHGTHVSGPTDSPFTLDYYGNVSVERTKEILDMAVFSEHEFRYAVGKRDLQFWGIKK